MHINLVFHNILIALILLAGAVISARKKKLTVPAAITGSIIGGMVYAGGGYTGLAMLAAFFIMGTAATSWKKNEKRLIRSNDAHQLTRNTGQVLANGGTAALAGLMTLLAPARGNLWEMMMAASLAAATADTLSSELGTVYGRRFYHILTWRQDQRGLDGVVSVEGLLFGLAGSVVIAGIFALAYGLSYRFFIIILAGTLGNLVDSLLGATLERQGRLTNDTVNFWCTVAAALAAACLCGWR